MPSLKDLPLEILQKVYFECPDIQSVVNLSATSRHFRAAYLGSQKFGIIENVLETQFGPLYDAIQLVTYNDSEPAHKPRNPPMSIALAKQVASVGYIAQKWEMIYPLLRWRDATDYRRVLRPHEGYRFRRAVYRTWLYGKAFHSSAFLELRRDYPMSCTKDRRLTYMRQFPDDEIIELTELNHVLHEMIYNDLCPSNAIIQKRYAQSFPGQGPLYFGSYETYPVNSMDIPHAKKVLKRDLPREHVSEAWGTFEAQRSIVEDVLKLNPDQLLHFRENLANRAERLAYLHSMPDVFHRNPATFLDAITAVGAEREYMIRNPSIDGGIIDYFDEAPGGRYEVPDDENSGDEYTVYGDEDSSEEEGDDNEGAEDADDENGGGEDSSGEDSSGEDADDERE